MLCAVWCADGHTVFDRHEIRLLCNDETGRENRNHEAGRWPTPHAPPFSPLSLPPFFPPFPPLTHSHDTLTLTSRVCLVERQALRFAKAMKAPLIFCSSSHSINIKTIFKIVVSKVFDLKCDVKKIDTVGDPIVGTCASLFFLSVLFAPRSLGCLLLALTAARETTR